MDTFQTDVDSMSACARGASGNQVSGKMKKMDPNDFTIADFMSECKNADEAESRFEEEPVESTRIFVAVNTNSKLGSLYARVARHLVKLGWEQKRTTDGRFHLVLGEAHGAGIPFRRMAQLFKWDYGIKPHCNFYRGCEAVTHKAAMATTLREHASKTGWDMDSCVPKTFVLYPNKPEDSETEAFRDEFEACRGGGANAWIVKPSMGTKGERIRIMDNYDAILSLVEAQEGKVPWVVQRYLPKPLLLPGDRKFDIRFWALVDHDYNVYIYRDGVCRTCSVPFSMRTLDDEFCHLTNHHLQEQHKDFGKHEEGNEMFTDEFEQWLDQQCGEGAYADGVFEPAKEIIKNVFSASKAKMNTQALEFLDYTSFQVFGLDFLLDEDLGLWLLEVNASPMVASALTDDFARDLVSVAVDPLYPTDKSGTPTKRGSSNFEKIELQEARRNKK